VIAFCHTEEPRPCLSRKRKHPAPDDTVSTPAKTQDRSEGRDLIAEAIKLVCVNSTRRALLCFLCVGNPTLPELQRVMPYSTPGSLTRHFQRIHIKSLEPEGAKVRCNVCETDLENAPSLSNHALYKHGTVVRTHLAESRVRRYQS
jgi:hypothetical protein